MDNIFAHDATPTWSGFIYQGSIALYLVIKKINELVEDAKKNGQEVDVESYYFEVETCEDICIFKEASTTNKKTYISIHQSKHEISTNQSNYRKPLIQLMLEKGFYNTRGVGNPSAYLHVSSNLTFDARSYVKQYKSEIIEFYDYFKSVSEEKISVNDSEILAKIKQEPIELGRTEYRKILESIKKYCESECDDEENLIEQINELIEFLENVICVQSIDDDVCVYKYENGDEFMQGSSIYDQILAQVKRYYQLSEKIELKERQYEYITLNLLDYMRKYVTKRHEDIKNKNKGALKKPFKSIVRILDHSVSEYDEEINILELKYLFQDRLGKYCKWVCSKNDCNLTEDNCYLNDHLENKMSNNEFMELCYSLNPNCQFKSDDRKCIAALLNNDGLNESVFKILENIEKKLLVAEEKKNRLVIRNQNQNCFITAISNNNDKMVVSEIISALGVHTNLISHIFEADTLVTTRLTSEKSIWGADFTDVSNKVSNNICEPKKPNFITAENF